MRRSTEGRIIKSSFRTPCSHSRGAMQIFSYSLPYPPHPFSSPATNSHQHSLEPCKPHWSGKQVGNFHSPSLIPSSAAGYLLWPLLPPCPHSQASAQSLVTHFVSLPPGAPLSTVPDSNHSPFLTVSSQDLETHPTQDSQWPHLAVSPEHSLPGNIKTPHSPKNQIGQQKPRNGTLPNKDNTRYQHLKL